MFTASEPFVFFEYFRVAHTVGATQPPGWLDPQSRLNDFGRVAVEGKESPTLLWARTDVARDVTSPGVRNEYHIGTATIFATVVPDAVLGPWLEQTGRRWERVTRITDAAANEVASVWVDEDSNVVLPFDPAEVMTVFWSEAYRDVGGSAGSRTRRLLLRSYYRVRPLVPRRLQIAVRRAGAQVQGRRRFPRWPIEASLHDFYELVFRWLAELASEPVPWIAPWPNGRSWAVVLTHDVETEVGVQKIRRLRDPERQRRLLSSWNFVPERYKVDDALLDDLRAQGFEVGVHGLRHDGRDLESLELVQQRAPAMRAYARKWSAVGFRSPATHRVWELMPLLGFDYDSSYPDTDPYEPIPGGCCTWLPFFNQDLVELPITLVQDHTQFVILKRRDATSWKEKCAFLRAHGGMALLITHPDYADDEGTLERAYGDLLDYVAEDETAWHALPREVAAWWRRRAASSIERSDGGWRIIGPASSEATIAFFGASEAQDA